MNIVKTKELCQGLFWSSTKVSSYKTVESYFPPVLTLKPVLLIANGHLKHSILALLTIVRYLQIDSTLLVF